MRPSLLVFDFDNTLEEFTPHEDAVEAELFDVLGKQYLISPAKMKEVFDDIKVAYAHPRALPTDYGRAVWFAELFRIFHIGEDVEAWVARYWDALFSRVRVFPGTYQALEELSERHTICILSDSDGELPIKLRRIEHVGLSPYVDRVFTSDSAGHNKPNARMFLQVLDWYGVAAEHAIMIGDNAFSDLAPAKEIGMHTVWQKESLRAAPQRAQHFAFVDYEIESIAQVPDAVRHIESHVAEAVPAVPVPQLHVQ